MVGEKDTDRLFFMLHELHPGFCWGCMIGEGEVVGGEKTVLSYQKDSPVLYK